MAKQTDEDDMREFYERLTDAARNDIIPKMQGSLFAFFLMQDEKDKDIWMALQIGLALLLDKPLVVVATDDVWIPARLRQIADLVVEGKSLKDPGLSERVAKLTAELLRKRDLTQ